MSKARKTSNLFQAEAAERRRKIEPGLHYQVFLLLEKGDRYEGYMHITFTLHETTGLFLDYCGDEVASLVVNGENVTVTESLLEKGRIGLPEAHLKADATNIVEIHFKNRFYNDGNGLHSLTDVDGSQYLYIQSEPFWNNRVLPLFDQPDLKAYFTLVSIMEKDWVLITSEDPELTQDWKEAYQPFNGIFHNKYFSMFKERSLGADKKLVIYPKSKLLPTYLFFFAVGPYTYFELPEEQRYRGIPMKVYCRSSMRQFLELQVQQFFDHHKMALEYFEQIFGLPYMFNKCDAIVCPEFTIGGMEYPGSITYAEALFARGKPNIGDITVAGNVACHEVSHMWFGDCVTSSWWNDTWLKESFADFVSYLCSANCSHKLNFEVEDAWVLFLRRKNWGYQDDSKSTTHPIAADIRSTEEADGVFDGISYSKGAACMKQLVYLVGMEDWTRAMKVYFERYAWKNAQLADLLNVYQEILNGEKGSPLDMNQWKEDWLETPGTNTVHATWSNDNNTVKLTQGFVLPQYPKLRYHKIKVSLFDNDANIIESKDVILNNSEVTEVQFTDLSKVKAVLPNDDDNDFIKVTLDPVSTEFFKQNISKIKKHITKAIIYKSLYDMVLDAQFKASDFVDFVINNYDEKEPEALINFILAFFRDVLFKYLTDAELRQKSKVVFRKAFEIFKKYDGHGPIADLSLTLMIDTAYSRSAIDTLKAIYDANKVGLTKTELSISKKWQIVKKIHLSTAYGVEEKKRYFDDLYKLDSSDTKEIYKVQIETATAETSEKLDAILDKCLSEELPFSFKVLQYHLNSLNDFHFPVELRSSILDKIYSKIDELTQDRSRSIAKSFMFYAFPKLDDLVSVESHLQKALGRLKAESKFSRKVLTQCLEDVQRVARAKAFALSN